MPELRGTELTGGGPMPAARAGVGASAVEGIGEGAKADSGMGAGDVAGAGVVASADGGVGDSVSVGAGGVSGAGASGATATDSGMGAGTVAASGIGASAHGGACASSASVAGSGIGVVTDASASIGAGTGADAGVGADTIAAIATASGAGAIGIVRISGAGAFAIAASIFRGKKRFELIKSHTAAHGFIVAPPDGAPAGAGGAGACAGGAGAGAGGSADWAGAGDAGDMLAPAGAVSAGNVVGLVDPANLADVAESAVPCGAGAGSGGSADWAGAGDLIAPAGAGAAAAPDSLVSPPAAPAPEFSASAPLEKLDEVLLIKMKAPRTYTREDVVEIQCHAGPDVTKRILRLVLRCGARAAEPGEFTKRAFLNGRLDLTQAEAVMDIIASTSEMGIRAALKLLDGGLRALVGDIRGQLLDLIASLDVYLDFPEYGEDQSFVSGAEASLRDMEGRLSRLADSHDRGRAAREGLAAAIVGKPNVGKSTLLNALAGGDRAIVTDVPGTTRDVVSEYVSLGGFTVRFSDTAGIRDTGDAIESIGVKKSLEALDGADLAIVVLDASEGGGALDGLDGVLGRLRGKAVLAVINKTDLSDAGRVGKIRAAMAERFAEPPSAIIEAALARGSGPAAGAAGGGAPYGAGGRAAVISQEVQGAPDVSGIADAAGATGAASAVDTAGMAGVVGMLSVADATGATDTAAASGIAGAAVASGIAGAVSAVGVAGMLNVADTVVAPGIASSAGAALGAAGMAADDPGAAKAVEMIGAAIKEMFGGGPPADGDYGILTNERQHALIQKCLASIRAAGESLRAGLPLEMPIIDMEDALSALREISGDAVPDDVIDRIFSNFCVGK
jgi:tRNA modification GTPase